MKKVLIYSNFLFVSALILLGAAGCALPKVPATEISFNPKTEALRVKSPKDVTIQSVAITQSSGNFSMTVTGYSSTNNAEVVGIVAQAQATIASNAAVTISALASQVTAAAVSAVK